MIVPMPPLRHAREARESRSAHFCRRQHGAAKQRAWAAQREGVYQLPQLLDLRGWEGGRVGRAGHKIKSGAYCWPPGAPLIRCLGAADRLGKCSTTQTTLWVSGTCSETVGCARFAAALVPATPSGAHLLRLRQVLHPSRDVLQRLVLRTRTKRGSAGTHVSKRHRTSLQPWVTGPAVQRPPQAPTWGCRKEMWLSSTSTPRSAPAPDSSRRYLAGGRAVAG